MSHTIVRPRTSSPLWLHEENYRLLIRYFSFALNSDKTYHYRITHHDHLSFQVAERHKFTYFLSLIYRFHSTENISPIKLDVRLYSDARVAEVVTYQGEARLATRFQGDRTPLQGIDERQQANRLLFELLQFIGKRELTPLSLASVADC